MAEYLKDFPNGPLDKYRKLATFDWKQLKVLLDTKEALEFKIRLQNLIKNHPELLETCSGTPTLCETRRSTFKKMFSLKAIRDEVASEVQQSIAKEIVYTELIYCLDFNTASKYSLAFEIFCNTVKMLGTERHQKFLDGSLSGEILGCFSLTEVAHGSNTRGIRARATYDQLSKEFILQTPDFKSAKCWSGCLGQTATHAVVFAHLVTPDGVNRGLHSFVVEIRDAQTRIPHPGVKIWDMGEKIGLNGIDNGLMMFDDFRIPRENLLNRNGDVTEDGIYMTNFEDPNKRHGASLGSISSVRIYITIWMNLNIVKALTIAIRYAAVRKQFNANPDDEEIAVLEYQTHQHRLLPHLALAYMFKIFCPYIIDKCESFNKLVQNEEGSGDVSSMGLEMHAISSAYKPVTSWFVRDAIQECREACGGYGYLQAAGIGDIRNTHDISLTIEGENHVLIQQTSNWLLKFWPLVFKGQKISTPLTSISFLNKGHSAILSYKFSATSVEEMIHPKNIFSAFEWLICFLLKATFDKCQNHAKSSNTHSGKYFWAKNDSQVFFAKSLAIAYIEHLMLRTMFDKVSQIDNPGIKNVLMKLFSMSSMICLEKHILTLYRGGFASGPNLAGLIQDSVLKLCKDLKDDAVALVDVVAPPDLVLHSVLGRSDGEVYKHLEALILGNPINPFRPNWWKEISQWRGANLKLNGLTDKLNEN